MYKRQASLAIMILLIVSFLMITIPKQTSGVKFVFASWTFPADEYGQGIHNISLWENSSGSWNQANWQDYYIDYTESGIVEWNDSLFIKLRVFSWFNSTYFETPADGRIFQRHNVTVTHYGTVVFFQQNFTFVAMDNTIDPPMWYYWYDVVLNFLPVGGEIYRVVINYDLFY